MKLRVHFCPGIDSEYSHLFKGFQVSSGLELNVDANILVGGLTEGMNLQNSNNLKAIIVPWAGVSGEICKFAVEQSVPVFNIHHNASVTAQTAIALMLAVTRDIVGMDREFRAGSWEARFEGARTMTLEGKVASVIGYGAIGKRIGVVCKALGMRVIGISRTEKSDTWGIDRLDEGLMLADILIIAAPLTSETKGLITREKLSKLKKGAVVINVGRGGIIEERALFDALSSGRLFGAGLDVWWRYPAGPSEEFRPGECDWASLKNVVMTPHRGGTGVEEIERWRAVREILERLRIGDFKTGQVDLKRGY